MEPKLVENTPPKFRVRRIAHGAEADLEEALNAAAEEGYYLYEALSQSNGDVLIVFHRGDRLVAGRGAAATAEPD